MFRKYLTEEEFYQKYSPYQKGETVAIIKPICTDDGKYEAGTEFVITDVELKPDIELPKVFSDEADSYYADQEMFRYQVQPKENFSEDSPTELPKVFSDEADSYYADQEMFRYQVQPKENLTENSSTFNVDIKYFTKVKINKVKCVEVIIALVGHFAFWLAIICAANYIYESVGIICAIIFCILSLIINVKLLLKFFTFVFKPKPTIHKKLKSH